MAAGEAGRHMNSAYTNPSLKKWWRLNLPTTEYVEVWETQRRLVNARIEGTYEKDLVLFLQHRPVFTLGRRGGRSNLCVSEEFLKEKRISLIQVERGGDITYHGPGQLVIYPIVDLGKARLGVSEFVTNLEEVLIRAAADWGVVAERNPANRGVWVGHNKLGSIGITIRKGITFHGAALNVNVDLEPFRWINPCGLTGVTMTSLKHQLARPVPMKQVCDSVKSHLEGVFEVELLDMARSTLGGLLEGRG